MHYPKITEDLELLADFRANVAIGRMEAREILFGFVDLGQIKLFFAERSDNIQDIQCPAALLGVELCEWTDSGVLLADCGRRYGLSIRNDFDSSV